MQSSRRPRLLFGEQLLKKLPPTGIVNLFEKAAEAFDILLSDKLFHRLMELRVRGTRTQVVGALALGFTGVRVPDNA